MLRSARLMASPALLPDMEQWCLELAKNIRGFTWAKKRNCPCRAAAQRMHRLRNTPSETIKQSFLGQECKVRPHSSYSIYTSGPVWFISPIPQPATLEMQLSQVENEWTSDALVTMLRLIWFLVDLVGIWTNQVLEGSVRDNARAKLASGLFVVAECL